MENYLHNNDIGWYHIAHGVIPDKMKAKYVLRNDRKSAYFPINGITGRFVIRYGNLAMIKQFNRFRRDDMIVIIIKGNLEMVKWVSKFITPDESFALIAGEYGKLDILCWMKQKFNIKITSTAFIKKVKDYKTLQLLNKELPNVNNKYIKYNRDLLEHHEELQGYRMLSAIIKYDRMDILKKISTHSFTLSQYFSRYNNLKEFKKVYVKIYHNGEFSENFSRYNNLKALKYLHKHGCFIIKYVLYHAILTNNFIVVKWFSKFYTIDKNSDNYFCFLKDYELIKDRPYMKKMNECINKYCPYIL